MITIHVLTENGSVVHYENPEDVNFDGGVLQIVLREGGPKRTHFYAVGGWRELWTTVSEDQDE